MSKDLIVKINRVLNYFTKVIQQMFFILYFVASLQCIFWTKTVGEGETIDLKFLSF